MQLSLHCAQPVFSVHEVCRMGKHKGWLMNSTRLSLSIYGTALAFEVEVEVVVAALVA
jgi:hypothetical protein